VWQSGIGNTIEPVTISSGFSPNYTVLSDFVSSHFRERAHILAADTRLANSSTGFREVLSRMQDQTFPNVAEHHERLDVFLSESRRIFREGVSIHGLNFLEGIGSVLNLMDTPTLQALEFFFSLPIRGSGSQGFQILVESGLFIGFFLVYFLQFVPLLIGLLRV